MTGPALLHKGEVVLSAADVRALAEGRSGGGNVTVSISGPVSIRREEDITALADEIARRIGARQNLRTRMGVAT